MSCAVQVGALQNRKQNNHMRESTGRSEGTSHDRAIYDTHTHTLPQKINNAKTIFNRVEYFRLSNTM